MAKGLSDTELASVVKELSVGDRALAAGAVPSIFCKNWPAAKSVLKLIAGASSSWVKLAVGVVLQIGNALYLKCPKP